VPTHTHTHTSTMSVHYVDDFMQAALREAERALAEGEVPVGCVFVPLQANEEAYQQLTSSGSATAENIDAWVAARGRNQTNALHHALAHAEFIAVQELLDSRAASEGQVGSTETTAPRAEAVGTLPNLSPYVLYVTVEPCVMCGAMLLYNEVGHVFFGCRNPRFGGNGTLLTLQTPPPSLTETRDDNGGHITDGNCFSSPVVHAHATPDASTAAAEETQELRQPTSALSSLEYEPQMSACVDEVKSLRVDTAETYDGPWWSGYTSEGGHREAAAVALLQQFYERENPNAPGHKRRQKPPTSCCSQR
jgi:tRNA-specific adenosine deaminase 2